MLLSILNYLSEFTAGLNPYRSFKARLAWSICAVTCAISICVSVLIEKAASKHIQGDVGEQLAELAYQLTDEIDRGMFELYQKNLQTVKTPNTIRKQHFNLLKQIAVLEKQLLLLISHDKEILILNHNGKLLLAPPGFNLKAEAKNLALVLNQTKQVDIKKSWLTTSSSGQTYITGFAHSLGESQYLGINYLVLVRQKTDIAFAPIKQLQAEILLWNFVFIGLSSIVGWLIADRITQPMRAIAATVDQISDGNNIQIPIFKGADEIAKLSKSLHKLVYTLTKQDNQLQASYRKLQTELSQRRLVEDSLRANEEKFCQLAENIQEVFWVSNSDFTQILYISPAYEKIWGRTCESLYAEPKSWIDAIHPEEQDLVLTQRQPNSNIAYNIEYRIVQPNGSIRWIWSRSFPVYDTMGKLYRRVGIAQDITERQQIEEIRNALKQEKELRELKSRFISQVSHEFRTPLMAINLSAEMLEQLSDKATQAQKDKYFGHIKLAIKSLTQLLDDVLIISKTEAGKLEFEPNGLNLTDFCSSIVEEIQLSTGEVCELNFVSQGCYNQTYLDENLLRLILTNLLSNAVKYSPKDSQVNFEVTCNQQSVTFRIQDHGIGIPAADQAKLFTAFYRCSNTGKLPGTGLGLSIVKDAVELHGGEIKVESEVGVGTTFTVKLPLKYVCEITSAKPSSLDFRDWSISL